MLSLFTSIANTLAAKGNTSIHHQKRFKVTTGETLNLEHNSPSLSKRTFPIWQITMPLCLVTVTSIVPLIAYSIAANSIAGGRYIFDFSLNREQIRIRADIDKQAISPPEKENTVFRLALGDLGGTLEVYTPSQNQSRTVNGL